VARAPGRDADHAAGHPFRRGAVPAHRLAVGTHRPGAGGLVHLARTPGLREPGGEPLLAALLPDDALSRDPALVPSTDAGARAHRLDSRPMSPSRVRLVDLAVLTLLALIARIGAAALVDYAPYTDPAYYSLVAERLATGQGFSVPVIWSFLEVGSRIPSQTVLPVASNGHWMPLTSVVAAAFMAILGPTWRAGQVPMVLLSALLVSLTYQVGWELWRQRSVALLGGILAIFAGPLLLYYPTIENFAVFGMAGALALYAATRAVTSARPGPWLVASGLFAGLATLARVDGLLFVVAPAIAWLVLRGWPSRALWAWVVASALVFAAILAPWLVRNAAVVGSPFPSAGGHTLWITSYNEQFSIGHPVNAAHYFAWAWGNLIA